MVIHRVEMCISLAKLAVEFVLSVAEAVHVVQQDGGGGDSLLPQLRRRTPSYAYSSSDPASAVSVPFVGFLP
ncbi:hypothetical protein LINPERHAP2_LOCUS41491 [Linum perenne]